MAIQIETVGNGVLFNGALTDKQGWILSASSDQTKVVLTNRITGLSSSSAVVEVEVDGSTFADYDALVAALGSVLFKSSGTGSDGVQSVTGDGVDNTDPENPTISYPTPVNIGAATAAQGSLAETAVQPAAIADMVESKQEGGVGWPIKNFLPITQDDFDNLSVKDPQTSYEIVTQYPA